ncbi:MAG: Fic family protein [Alkalinema sp. RL_2_19]|nr:Fic family protein [Alkalinema sp. RL_2_19]
MTPYLQQLKAQYDALLPPAPAAAQAFNAWVDVEYTYESNAIEGNTLTRGETGILLDKGFASGNKPYLHYSEALDHKDAVDLIRTMGAAQSPIVQYDIKEIHAAVTQRSYPFIAGKWRDTQAWAAGMDTRYAEPHDIPARMGDFCDWLNAEAGQAMDIIQYVSRAHYELAAIHPFSDGNGRTARLLMNLLLIRRGYPIAIIRMRDRDRYLDALSTAATGDFQPFERLIAEAVEESLRRAIAFFS